MRGVSIFEFQSHMESLSVDLKTSQPLLIATDGTGFICTINSEKEKKRNLLSAPHLPRRLHLMIPAPNPIRRNINPFHDAII